MSNHPNRRRGQPPLPPGQHRKRLPFTVAPDVHAAAVEAGRDRVEAVLRAGLMA